MALTPLDIEKQEFSRVPLGYRVRDVQEFLGEVSRTLEEHLREKDSLQSRVEQLSEKVQDFERREAQLTDLLRTAQEAVDLMKRKAEKERDLIVSEARHEADKVRSEATHLIESAHNEVNELVVEKSRVRAELRRFSGEIENLLGKDLVETEGE